jgi:hypothetical protein
MDRAERVYPNDRKTILVLFGLLEARVEESASSAGGYSGAWRPRVSDKEHALLTAFAGGARRPAS